MPTSGGGFIFVNLAQDPISFEDQMGALIEKFKDWKLILPNYQECYHFPGVHPLLSKLTPFQSVVHDCNEGAVMGGYMILEPGAMNGEPAGPPVCDVHGDDMGRVYYYSVFPNMLLTPHPDFVLFHHIIPRGNGAITNTCYWLYHPDVMADPDHKERLQSAVEFWDLTNREDWTVCELMQQGTKSRRFTRGTYSGQEDMLYTLDQELLRVLGHKSPE